MAYSQLSHETQQSYATIKEALSQRFELPSKQQLYKVEFKSKQRQDKESWADFSDNLLLLASMVFPGLQDQAREELAQSEYILRQA